MTINHTDLLVIYFTGDRFLSRIHFQVFSLYLRFIILAFHRAPVAQLVEHRAVMQEVVSLTPAGPTLRVLK